MKLKQLSIDGQSFTVPESTYHKGEDEIHWGDDGWPFPNNSVAIIEPTVSDMFKLNPKDTPDSELKWSSVVREQIRNMSEDGPYNIGWYGGTYDEMVARKKGWHEGVSKMMEQVDRIVPEFGHAKRPRPYWHLEGYELDLDRFNDGHEKPWLERRRRRGPRNLHITVNYGENCGVSSEALFRRGAATVAAIDTLEDMGYRVELTTLDYVKGCWTDMENFALVTRIAVKHPQDPVDLSYLASTLCSPLFFRGNGFLLWRMTEHTPCSSLGSSRPIPEVLQGEVHVSDLPDDEEEARELYDKIIQAAVRTKNCLDIATR